MSESSLDVARLDPLKPKEVWSTPEFPPYILIVQAAPFRMAHSTFIHGDLSSSFSRHDARNRPNDRLNSATINSGVHFRSPLWFSGILYIPGYGSLGRAASAIGKETKP